MICIYILHIEVYLYLIKKDVLHILLVEYHKWLQLLGFHANNNNKYKLSSSQIINRIWHEHINMPNYIIACDIICGYKLDHFPMNTNSINKTIELYTEYFVDMKKTHEIWDPLMINNKININADYKIKIRTKCLGNHERNKYWSQNHLSLNNRHFPTQHSGMCAWKSRRINMLCHSI